MWQDFSHQEQGEREDGYFPVCVQLRDYWDSAHSAPKLKSPQSIDKLFPWRHSLGTLSPEDGEKAELFHSS